MFGKMRPVRRYRLAILWTAVSMCLLCGVLMLLDMRSGFYVNYYGRLGFSTIQKMVDWTHLPGSPARSKYLTQNISSEEWTLNGTGKSFSLSGATNMQQKQPQQQQQQNQLQQQQQELQLQQQKQMQRQQQLLSHVPPVYLCVNDLGRIGNELFEVAAMLGTARRYSVTPAIPAEGGLHRMFKIPYIELPKHEYSHFNSFNDAIPCSYTAIKANFTTNTTMKGYFQSWRYFSDVLPELKQSLIFVDEFRSKASDALLTFIHDQHGNISVKNRTFVGLHVRRGDLIYNKKKIKYGYKIGTEKYIRKAMSFFLEKFPSVMFIVCSDDMDWTQKVVPSENATFSKNKSAEFDLAILSQCNHTIMTVGSFGWWASWLAGGITVYQRQQVREGSSLAREFNLTDYMLPDWIPIDETG